MQAVLAANVPKLEQALQNAADGVRKSRTSRVSIGTIVTVRDRASRKQETYTILGAWDGNPESTYHFLSNSNRPALLGHKAGEV